MKRILQELDNYWFTPGASERLAILRIATGYFLLDEIGVCPNTAVYDKLSKFLVNDLL